MQLQKKIMHKKSGALKSVSPSANKRAKLIEGQIITTTSKPLHNDNEKSRNKSISRNAEMKLIEFSSLCPIMPKDANDATIWRNQLQHEMKQRPDAKWITLQHNGVLFCDPYVPHNTALLYGKREIKLSPEAEEAATLFANYIGSAHYEKSQFKSNFFRDFMEIITSTMGRNTGIKSFEKCNFERFVQLLSDRRREKMQISKEDAKMQKQKANEKRAQYKYAMVNGIAEPIGNFMIEPPGIFLGRGDHPRTGCIKKRIMPENVTLNLSHNAIIPTCPIPGHDWKKIVHDPTVAWIASWTETSTKKIKYVLFASGSSLKAKSDRKKYEKARALKPLIEKIRKNYNDGLRARVSKTRQIATAMWIIDNLALRVGNEKSSDEADTVGCCSLRVEHVTTTAENFICFDFLGKDSMRYHRNVKVPPLVFKNILEFRKGKSNGSDLFDELTPTILNDHLKSLMPGLTAKVFRTFNASMTMQRELEKFVPSEESNIADILLHYNKSNRAVAVLCNHQKTVSKNHAIQVEKMSETVVGLENMIQLLKQRRIDISSESDCLDDPVIDQDSGQQVKLPKTIKACDARISALKMRIKIKEANIVDKNEGASIQNSTSKINYMDPRISIAYCKRTGMPLQKVFSTTLIDKFSWAIEEIEDDPDFVW